MLYLKRVSAVLLFSLAFIGVLMISQHLFSINFVWGLIGSTIMSVSVGMVSGPIFYDVSHIQGG